MKNCPNCGVTLDENANFCSLCGEPLLERNETNLAFIETRQKERKDKILTEYRKLSGFQKRKLFLKISGMILLSGIFITLVIDFVLNGTLSWSRYPVTVGLVLLLNITMGTFWAQRELLWGGLSFISSSVLLVLLDIYSGNSGWGMQLGIPLLFAAYVTVLLLFRLIRRASQKGLNVVAYSLVTSGILCICTEGIINLYWFDSLDFRWSLIVMASSVVTASLMLYVHYRLKKVTDLKRFFHI
ncbi:DUF6320 domain-containing protein [Marinilabilia salmonicolor]|jgi:hypothetical protein|uniref:Zinc ribbon protein n=1 Tax=Marinilabilia salmonicolor TaxID=989 RepID=A0A2T0XR78_9BACT|nr:DUF6320 domain-containing protein [Marinilabilia salmonicolor]PRZ01427.1 zinc ribbon protein [Marinilabilia salmonicolor]RCW31961.1 zinc ribbon protein [Marinilabilia salmonicolor]